MLRVVAGLALRRGRLRYVYQVLRGKDLETGEISAATREKQFATRYRRLRQRPWP